MPEFVNPFSGVVPREMSHGELVRAIMLDIAAELEAVHLYLAHMDATTNEEAKKVLFDVAQEELVHAGEFTSLLYRLDPISGAKAKQGFDEVADLLGSKAPSEVESSVQVPGEEEPAEEGPPVPQGLTVGNLIGRPQGS
jgi:rubrerythrin